ncbi:hypothetical protein GCM10010151_03330 [Actinoallomurus spadix]|uniref:Uncharacterized protein n=1 Tax=Actinoallomurus spadix TaxID=79912 RepID=A0ABP3FI68_9ACTN
MKWGKQTNGPEPHDSSTVVECEWANSGLNDQHRKQGTIKVGAHVDLMHTASGDPYLGARIYYRTFTTGKKCEKVSVNAPEACWYADPGTSLTVVLRDDYSTVWLTCDAMNSPSLSRGRIHETANRVARELLDNLK